MNLRKLHRKIAPIVFLPLFLAALTGIGYRLGGSLFGLPGNVTEFFMVLHQGEFLGEPLVPLYVLLMGGGLLGLIISGVVMFRRKGAAPKTVRQDHRWMHRNLAILGFLPLAVSALTGVAYAIGSQWLGFSGEDIGFLLRLHQGYYFGSVLRVVYVCLIGVGLVGLLITGIQMTGIFRKPRAQPPANP